MADVVHPVTGGIVSIPDEQLAQAQNEGFRVAAPDAVAAERQAQQYSGPTHALGALASGVASGATLGLSDAAISGLGGREALQAYEHNYGGLRTVGEVGGTLLGLGKFAGPGLAAKGLRAASMPSRFAVGAGAAVERHLGGKALGLVARGATEGAIFGAGQGISDLALSDDPLTGEKIAAALSSNAFTGAAYGGAFSAGLLGIGKAGNAIGKKLAGVGDDGVSKLVGAWDKASSAIGASEPGAITAMFKKNASGVRGFELATKADDIVAKAGDDVFERTQNVMRARDAVADNFSGALKESQIKRVVKRGNEGEAYAATKAFVSDMRGQFDDMVARGDVEFARQGTIKKMSKKLDKLERKLDFANAIGDETANARAYMQLDSFKRDIGKHTRKLKRARGATSDVQNSATRFEEMYESTRGILEDVGVWGDAGALQKRMNAPWSSQIHAEKGFLGTITKRVEGKWGTSKLAIDREKIGKYVADLRDPNASQTHQGLKQWLDSTQDFADAALESMHLPPAERKAVVELASHTKALRGRLDDAAEAISLSNTLADMGKKGDANAVLGGIAGHAVLGGPAGAALGTAASIVTNPASMIHKVATVGRLVGKVDARLAGGVKGFLRRSGRKAAVGAPRLTQPSYSFLDKHNRFSQREKDVRHRAENRVAVREQAMQQTAGMADTHPAAAQAAVDRLEAKNDFLLRKLPIGADSLMLGRAPQLSKAEMDRFLRFDEAANDPMKIPKLLEQGKLSPDHVEAVKAVWPGIYQQMQDDAMDGLAEMSAKGQRLPYQEALQLGLLLDIPAHPTMEPKMIAMLQQGYTQDGSAPSGAPPKRGKSIDLAGSVSALRTKTQELEESDE